MTTCCEINMERIMTILKVCLNLTRGVCVCWGGGGRKRSLWQFWFLFFTMKNFESNFPGKEDKKGGGGRRENSQDSNKI